MAPELEALYQEYKDRGLMVITLLGEDASGGAADLETVQSWVDTCGLNYAVVADPRFGVSWQGGYLAGGRPGESLLAPGMEIVKLADWVEAAEVEEVLPEN